MHEHPYNIIFGRHLHVTDTMKEYVTNKLQKIERLVDNIIDINVTLDVQKVLNSVTIVMHFGHYTVKVEASTDNMYASVDQAVHKLSHLLHRYKDKLKAHHTKGHGEVNLDVDVYGPPSEEDLINDAIDEENARRDEKRFTFHKIVRRDKHPLKTLSRTEALMKMELSSAPFLIFKSEEDQKVKVIYRMADENYGIVEPL